MSRKNSLLTPSQAETSLPRKNEMLAVNTQKSMRREHQSAHLARLFRHVGQSPEGLYLQGLITRYREIEAP